jgi:hypothetical protein
MVRAVTPMNNQDDGEKPRGQSHYQSLSNPPPQSAVPKAEIPADSKDKPSNDQATAKELRREFRWFEIASLVINGALAIIGIIALCIYHGQLSTMNQTYAEIRKQTNAATKSADAAKSAADTAAGSLDVSQRAYLSVGSADFTPDGVKIHIINFGHIPAKLLDSCLAYARFSVPTLQEPAKRQTGAPFLPIDSREFPVPAGARISPNSASQFAIYFTLPKLAEQDVQDVISGKQTLVIYGTLNFDTGFGKSDSVVVNVTRTGNQWVKLDEGIHVDSRR